MTTNQNYGMGSSDANQRDESRIYDPTVSGAGIAGSTYSTQSYDPSIRTGDYSSNASSRNDKMQMLTEYYNKAAQWVKENPAAAISAAAGLVAAVSGIVAATQSSGRKKEYLDRYPNGKTYGSPYSSGSVSYNPATQQETIGTGGNYPDSGTGNYSGYESAGRNI